MYSNLEIIRECMFAILYFRFSYKTFNMNSSGPNTFTHVSSEKLNICNSPKFYSWNCFVCWLVQVPHLFFNYARRWVDSSRRFFSVSFNVLSSFLSSVLSCVLSSALSSVLSSIDHV